MSACSHCGGTGVEPNSTAHTSDADKLLAILKRKGGNSKPLQVYEADRRYGGGWFITYDNGQTTREAVMELVRRGEIRSCYSNCPEGTYHIGRTLDYERTMAARKKLGKGAPDYFVGDR